MKHFGVDLRHAAVGLLSATCWHLADAQAINGSEGIARALRDVRQDARQERSKLLDELPKTPKATVDAGIGLAYDRDEEKTRELDTPFFVSYKTPGADWWKLKVSGSGYSRITAPGEQALTGLSDIQLNVIRPMIPDHLSGYVGLVAPTHGDVGSKSWAQRAGLTLTGDFNPTWSYVAIAGVVRKNGSPAGVSAYRKLGYLEIDYNSPGGSTVLANLMRTYRAGAGGSTELGMEYDFPIQKNKLSGALSVVRGISTGRHHTGVEFDLIFRF